MEFPMRLASRPTLTAVFLAMASAACAGTVTISNPNSTAWDTAKWDDDPMVYCRVDNPGKEICVVTKDSPRMSAENWRSQGDPRSEPVLTNRELEFLIPLLGLRRPPQQRAPARQEDFPNRVLGQELPLSFAWDPAVARLAALPDPLGMGSTDQVYRGSSGALYKYDLGNPFDQVRYSADPLAQLKDGVDPRVGIDRGLGQYGGGITP
jgi:hypothetical protein